MLRFLGTGLLALALPAVTLASALVESLNGDAYRGTAPLRQGERVLAGSTLTTGAQSRLRLRFDDGMELALEERSELRLVDFRYARNGAGNRVVLDLLSGAARFATGEIARTNPQQLFVRTPQASFGVTGPSEFSVVLADGAYVSVSRGTVTAANRDGDASLGAGTIVFIRSAGTAPRTTTAVPPRVASALGSLGAAAPRAEPAPRPAPVAAAPVAAAPVAAPSPRPAPRLFLGAAGGASDIDEEVTRGLIDTGSVDGKGTGFKVFGGYLFHPNIGAEIAYVRLGDLTYEGTFSGMAVTGGKVKVSGINLAALGWLPVGERFAVFAKIGAFFWEVEASDVGGGVPFSAKADGIDPSFGIGASFNITRNIALRAEGEVFRVDKDNARLLSLGLALSF